MVDYLALAVITPLFVLVLVVGFGQYGNSAQATVPAVSAAFLVLVGAIGGSPATDEIADIGPTVIFFSLLLVLGYLCAEEGVFDWATSRLASHVERTPKAALTRVFVVALVTTAILTVHAMVVFLTPIVVATLRRRVADLRPYAVASGQVAQSTALLTPVSTLPALLAVALSGLSFVAFVGHLVLPWVAAVFVSYAALRVLAARRTAGELATHAVIARASISTNESRTRTQTRTPGLALAVLALTVLGFVASTPLGFAPLWAAVAGVLVLTAKRLIDRTSSIPTIMESANVPLALFVVSLAVIVRGLRQNGADVLLADVLPAAQSWPALLAVAGIAALLTNLVTDVAAALMLLPTAVLIGLPTLFAVVIGCTVGASLTVVGSITNQLWRRSLPSYSQPPTSLQFTVFGVFLVPVSLIASTTALWAGTHLFS